ncbi:histidine phosphatase family protein [Celeribacter indicus]|uniref:Phosphoglycerate mutase n=1 Tax=Celeribacter indicus TaxID=1208324 RepID=A0A0B5E695_9RHOB|nr:histidine phosphatase family protein [Celeribacter indicus]AJE48541.1 phosphoglycerate mutase [Celeribacter indicus]SDX08064.1 Broad specificity phosphatase PhoE [Celeribacter indicus]
MNRLWLVRHGPTHARCFVGWSDLPADLSDRAALARLEAALPQVPVISSDLRRAVDTATALQGPRPRLAHDPRLRETHFGAWELHSWAQIEQADAALAREVFETPGSAAPPGGESWNAFSARVHAAIDALDGETIVVAHMGVVLAVLQRALGVTAYEALAHRIDPLSCTCIERPDGAQGHWRAAAINQIY